MTSLRKDAFDLLNQIPEDKLIFVIQIMKGIEGLYAADNKSEKEKAFECLETMRKKVPSFDYDKELADYREEKYGNAYIG